MPRSLALLIALLALAALAAPAGAVQPGKNGRIVFTSGRDVGDMQARLYHVTTRAIATVSPAFTPVNGLQHKHPNWSPDRTKVAYSRGTPNTFALEDFEIFIQDLTTGSITPVSPDDTQTSDRAAFSPDGTKVAYDEEVGDNDKSRDIIVHDLATGQRVNLTDDVAAAATKAAWTPDGSTIYFSVGDPTGANTMNVMKRPADKSAASDGVLTDPAISEFQHAISPDGRNLCWSEGTGFNNSADVWTGPIQAPGDNKVNLSDDAVKGDINCVWSPEGDEVAYVKGVFEKGSVVRAEWPDTGVELGVTNDVDDNKFDGNLDWAIDGRPDCPDVTVQTTPGAPVTIPIVCPDTGPQYERTEVKVVLRGDPANGTATDPFDTGSSTYTPTAGFTGTDTFTYTGFDAAGFAEDLGTVTVNVVAPQQPGGQGPTGPVEPGAGQTPPPPPPPPAVTCAGRVATIVGNARSNTIRGTSKRDVIAARGGNDVVLGLGGNDIICLGAGNDRGSGGAGADRILGGTGRDRLIGGVGRDVLRGGAGRDLVRQ